MDGFCKTYYVKNTSIVPHANLIQGFRPQDLLKAYNLVQMTGLSPVKIGIVSLGGNVNPSDVQACFAGWGLPTPTVTMISTDGNNPPSNPGGADVENLLDVEWAAGIWSVCTGTPADIVFCSAPNSDNGIADAITALIQVGCKKISISWGANLNVWSATARAYTNVALQNAVSKNITVTVASGDNSANDGTRSKIVDFPCSSLYAWAVGGTTLVLRQDGTIQSESAWGDGNSASPGGGGGYDPNSPQPDWQSLAVGNKSPFRGVPDMSMPADPRTGGSVYEGGQWKVIGGTSWSAPTAAGYFAVCEAIMATKGQHWNGQLGSILYFHPEAFNDVIEGSNGFPSDAGWDAATGLGSISGHGMVSALLGVSPPTTPVPPPTTQPPVLPHVYQISLPNGLPASLIKVRINGRIYEIINHNHIPPKQIYNLS